MATEEYCVGYDEGYQAGWNAAIDADQSIKPEQKPIAYLYHDTACVELANPLADSTLLVLACDRKPNGRNETPLYTAPPKREWVGLTETERINLEILMIGQIQVAGLNVKGISNAIRAVEQVLKERNT